MARLTEYDYELPLESIAQHPLEDRTSSRLLVLDKRTGVVSHRMFCESVELLHPGDLLVMNDTRVSAVRLSGHKDTGGHVEALLLRQISADSYLALLKPGRRLKIGAKVLFTEGLSAFVTGQREEGLRTLQFENTDDLSARIAQNGSIPLPPYIQFKLADPERYQTVVAKTPGSAAAPTAGLHFSREMLSDLASKGVKVATVTLDVGIDTFRPVQSDDLEEHKMHGERCEISEGTADLIASCTGRIVAVGTTTVRTLESLAIGHRRVQSGSMVTRLFIQPGFQFRIVDAMFTNFHLPRTTMLMMISAFCRRDWVLHAYQEAIAEEYRFLSFGDSMLIA